jgi:hypothetical protein
MAALATLPAFATLSAFAFAVIIATRSTLVDVGHEVMIQHPSRKRHFWQSRARKKTQRRSTVSWPPHRRR